MSAILMLRHLDLADLADRVEAALLATLRAGIKTPDLGGRAGTKEFAKADCRAALRLAVSTAPLSESSAPGRRSCRAPCAWQPSRRPSPMS